MLFLKKWKEIYIRKFNENANNTKVLFWLNFKKKYAKEQKMFYAYLKELNKNVF